MAVLVPIVTEAGGGSNPPWMGGQDGCRGGSAVATNGILHDEVLARIGTASTAYDAESADRGERLSAVSSANRGIRNCPGLRHSS